MRNMLDNLPDKPGCNCVPIAGRCPKCNEVIATGRETCESCGWKVVDSELIQLQASTFSPSLRK